MRPTGMDVKMALTASANPLSGTLHRCRLERYSYAPEVDMAASPLRRCSDGNEYQGYSYRLLCHCRPWGVICMRFNRKLFSF